MLRIKRHSVVAMVLGGGEHHATALGIGLEQGHAMLGAEFGDPMQIGDQPLGQRVLWPGEQFQQRVACRLIVAVERGRVQLPGVGRLPVEQSA